MTRGVPEGPAPGGRAAEAMIAFALLSLAGAFAWAIGEPSLLHGPFYLPRVLALTHLVTLGWVTSVAVGVFLLLSPPILQTRPKGSRPSTALFVLWFLGATGTAFHMGEGNWFGVWTGAALATAAIVFFTVMHRDVFGRAFRGNWIAVYAAAAMVNLLLAAAAGTLLGWERGRGWFPPTPWAGVGLHLILAEAGWVTLLVLGFGRKLLPTLAPERARDRWESPLRFGTMVVGTWGTAACVLFAPRWVPLFAFVLGGSILLHLLRPLGKWLAGRVRDRASFWGSAALACLALDVLLGLALAVGLFPETARVRALFAFGFLALAGWNTLAITSFALKLFPMWVWQVRFQKDLGKRPVPAMMDLYSHRLQHVTGFALFAGSLAGTAGLLAGVTPLTDWGVRLAGFGVLSFLVNFAMVLRWRIPSVAYRPGEEDWRKFEETWGEHAPE
jgi:hypothetical protein